MNALRPHLRLPVWIALVAMLALALLPTLSHALTFARGGSGAWVEVCTPQGMRLVQVAGDETPAPLQAGSHLEHCPLCVLPHVDAAPPPAVPAVLPLPLAAFSPPPAFLHAPVTLYAWRSASPRGPPSRS